ncbi:GDSL esterase/lipase, partial [Mucuna pruriens]
MTPTIHLLILMHVCTIVVAMSNTHPTYTISSILVFGDSTVDTGNNNYIEWTLVKANYLPYGKDFPGHLPTGRFSNGKLVVDFLASILNLKDSVPPYLNPNLSDKELLTGVCFASGGSGIDDLTATSANVISMPHQIEYFKTYAEKLRLIAGKNKSTQILEDALVVISVGANDIIFNFYDLPTRRMMFININTYQDYLLDRLQIFIKRFCTVF